MKRSVIQTLFLIPFLLLLPVANLNAQAYEAEGTWEITWETHMGESRSFTVTLHQDDEDAIKGTAEIPRGIFMEEAGEGTETVGLMHGDTHGNFVTFKLRPLTQSHTSQVIAVYGAVSDERMEGYLTGVMPQPETAVPFVGQKRY